MTEGLRHCSACRAPARFSWINPQRFWMRNVGTGSSRICPDTRATGYFSHSIHGRILVGLWHEHKARITNSQPLTIQLAPDFGHQCRKCDYHIDKRGKPLTQIARNLTEIILDLSWQTTFCAFLKIPKQFLSDGFSIGVWLSTPCHKSRRRLIWLGDVKKIQWELEILVMTLLFYGIISESNYHIVGKPSVFFCRHAIVDP